MTVATFGTLTDGRTVEIAKLSSGTLNVSVLTLGAILSDVRLAGVDHGLTLGSPDIDAYAGRMGHFGAVMGPVANRIGQARATVDGRALPLEANGPGGHTQHGGSAGLHRKIWDVVDAGPDRIVLALDLPDGEGGFPGRRRITATYGVEDTALSLVLTAATDAPALMNLAHHGYWTMDGEPTWDGHGLTVHADHWLPSDADNLPSGEIATVAGGWADFRTPRVLNAAALPRLDNNWCLAGARGPLRPAAELRGRSGLSMRLDTTEPGLQVFDMATIDCGDAATHHRHPYGPRAGLALEPQFWPDAPNNATFPDIVLRPGQDWRHETRWTFARA